MTYRRTTRILQAQPNLAFAFPNNGFFYNQTIAWMMAPYRQPIQKVAELAARITTYRDANRWLTGGGANLWNSFAGAAYGNIVKSIGAHFGGVI